MFNLQHRVSRCVVSLYYNEFSFSHQHSYRLLGACRELQNQLVVDLLFVAETDISLRRYGFHCRYSIGPRGYQFCNNFVGSITGKYGTLSTQEFCVQIFQRLSSTTCALLRQVDLAIRHSPWSARPEEASRTLSILFGCSADDVSAEDGQRHGETV